MIKNERQHRITRAQLSKFERALDELARGATDSKQLHPLLQKAQRDALISQIADLRMQLEEYEALRSHHTTVLELASFDELPRVLIQARISSGMSQKELAEQLGLKMQQIQRYEATEYASASLARITEVIRALGVRMRQDVFLPSAQISAASLFKRLASVGLDREFILKLLLPRRLAASLEVASEENEEGIDILLLRAAAVVGRVFGLTPASIFASTPLRLNLATVGTPRFKVGARTNEQRLTAYTVYAHYLALLLLQATADLSAKPIPTDAAEVRRAISSAYGSITFENVVRYVWSLGVPVLPLKDPGAFHAAYWRIDGRNIIVLKQRTRSVARWLVDLLHELCHASQEPEIDHIAIIESIEALKVSRESEEEYKATKFANDIVLNGRTEQLVNLCVEAARGSVERLKSTVPRVAVRENVPVDVLANYMAFRLSMQDIDWWGAATNLQNTEQDPWQIARDILFENTNFQPLNEVDRELLLQALADVEV